MEGLDLAGKENPVGSVGREMVPPLGGHGVSCAKDPFSSRGWTSSLEGEVAGLSSGGKPVARPGAAHANGL